jgi:hypothetical protein
LKKKARGLALEMENPEGDVVSGKVRRKQILHVLTENELVKCLLVMENKLCGFTGKINALYFINLLKEIEQNIHLIKFEGQEGFGYIISLVFAGTRSLYLNGVEPHLLGLRAITGKCKLVLQHA